jgi:hypothetical protein
MALLHQVAREISPEDRGLQAQFAACPCIAGHFPAKDESIFFRLSDGSVHVEQALGELVDGGVAEEDQVVAKLDLGKEEPGLTAGLSPFWGGEEGSKGGQPLLPAAQ